MGKDRQSLSTTMLDNQGQDDIIIDSQSDIDYTVYGLWFNTVYLHIHVFWFKNLFHFVERFLSLFLSFFFGFYVLWLHK